MGVGKEARIYSERSQYGLRIAGSFPGWCPSLTTEHWPLAFNDGDRLQDLSYMKSTSIATSV